MKTRRGKFKAVGLALVLLSMAGSTQAVPTFQVYIDGGTAGDWGSDEDTWYTDGSPFELWLIGAHQNNTANLTDAVLVASVPEGVSGTVTVGALAGSGPFDTKADFLPAGETFNDHYPFKDDVSDFLTWDVGTFGSGETVADYNADNGSISGSADGEIKEYQVTVTGYDRVHFDLYGWVDKENGQDAWDINPGSHDSLYASGTARIPAPGALVLSALGTGFVAFARRRRILQN